MKSILISADFVHDSNGDLRLLEINTNTGIIPSQLPYFDFSNLKTFLLGNSFTKLVFVYNNNQSLFINHFKNWFDSDVELSGLELELVKVFDTFYGLPSNLVDNESTFIIRAVYDYTAIVDSEFCANEINLYDLFISNNDTGSIPNLKFKRPDSTEFDNLLRVSNQENNIPDYFLKKAVFSPYVNNKMVKLQSGTTIDDLISSDSTILDTYVVENYHFHPTLSVDENKIFAIRAYQLWYGSNLDAIDLCYVQNSALTELPPLTDFSVVNNYVDKKWKYSYISNFLTTHDGPKQHGYREDSLVELSDGTTKQLKDVVVGDVVKSYIITSLPDAVSNTYNWFEWKQTKAEYDSLSKNIATTTTEQIDAVQLNDFAVELTFENDIKYYTLFGSGILTWQLDTDTVQFISATNIKPNDRVITSSGNGLIVQDMNVVFDTGSYYSLDVEESDTIILKPTDIIVHNYECFAAGTKISMSDGTTKNIEDVKSGDVVVSYNLLTKQNEDKIVGNLLSVLSDHISHVNLSNDVTLRITNDHPIYTENGWSSIDVELTQTKYTIPVSQLNIGDKVKTLDGEVTIVSIETINEPVMTFTLKDVEDNSNFYADGVLVHNRPMICFIAGTKVMTENGLEKNIEDLIVGDVVASFNEVTKIVEYKKVLGINNPIHDDLVEYTFSNNTNLTCTHDHPIYVNGLDLSSFRPDYTSKRYKLEVEVKQIKVGDEVNLFNNEKVTIQDIKVLPEEYTQTYIINVEDNHNFFANNILVHNK